MIIAPAFCKFVTTGESNFATTSRRADTPFEVGHPIWSTLILTVTGTPCKIPVSFPESRALSNSSALTKACSERSITTAFKRGLTSCIRSIFDWTIETTEISPAVVDFTISLALNFHKSFFNIKNLSY